MTTERRVTANLVYTRCATMLPSTLRHVTRGHEQHRFLLLNCLNSKMKLKQNSFKTVSKLCWNCFVSISFRCADSLFWALNPQAYIPVCGSMAVKYRTYGYLPDRIRLARPNYSAGWQRRDQFRRVIDNAVGGENRTRDLLITSPAFWPCTPPPSCTCKLLGAAVFSPLHA